MGFFSKCLLRLGVLRVFVLLCVLVFLTLFVPLNLIYLRCLQHSFFEYLLNLYYTDGGKANKTVLFFVFDQLSNDKTLCIYYSDILFNAVLPLKWGKYGKRHLFKLF